MSIRPIEGEIQVERSTGVYSNYRRTPPPPFRPFSVPLSFGYARRRVTQKLCKKCRKVRHASFHALLTAVSTSFSSTQRGAILISPGCRRRDQERKDRNDRVTEKKEEREREGGRKREEGKRGTSERRTTREHKRATSSINLFEV